MAPMAWVLEWKDKGSSGRIGEGDEEEARTFYDSELLEFIYLCLQMDEELRESLWVRIKGRAGVGDVRAGGLLQVPSSERPSGWR